MPTPIPPSYTFEAKARIPTRPLSIASSSLRINKELLVDYDKAEVWVSKADGTLVNVTSSVIETIRNNPQVIKDIVITLSDGSKYTIENSIIEAFNRINNLRVLLGWTNNTTLKIPAKHIVQDSTHRFITDADKTNWTNFINGLIGTLNYNSTNKTMSISASFINNTGDVNRMWFTQALMTKYNAKATITEGTFVVSQNSGWAGNDTSGWYCTINKTGVLNTDKPVIDVVVNTNKATAEKEEEEFAKIYKISTMTNAFRVYAKEKLTMAITLQYKTDRSG